MMEQNEMNCINVCNPILLKKVFLIFPVSKPTVYLCVMYEVKLG